MDFTNRNIKKLKTNKKQKLKTYFEKSKLENDLDELIKLLSIKIWDIVDTLIDLTSKSLKNGDLSIEEFDNMIMRVGVHDNIKNSCFRKNFIDYLNRYNDYPGNEYYDIIVDIIRDRLFYRDNIN